jgi:hypothetical protein
MTSRDRDKVCENCPLPDCRESDPGCLLKKGKTEEILISSSWGINETATRLGCKSSDWLREEAKKLKRGEKANIPRFFMIGNRYRWDPADVETWLEVNKIGGAK